LTLDAARRVGQTGTVIALDISHDALIACRRARSPADPVEMVVGDALSLPLPAECIDAVVARSVLIYIVDKARAVSEFHRVLRAGGRVSIFEPINRAYKSLADVDLADLEPAHRHVLDHWHTGDDPGDAMTSFDERDLINHFVNAGFESVDLAYEVSRRRRPARRDEVAAFLTIRPNPNVVSDEESAREVLGTAADDHLEALATALTSQPSTSVSAAAYLRARRARR
jgi:arsenite methyltransferase